MAESMRRETFHMREFLRRLADGDLERRWPRVQKSREGSTMMILAALPGIDAALEVRAATREAGEQQATKEVPVTPG